jgi:lipopolysaccharide/colanic/teichoic acid biosynthesis glycosyltransferase
MSVLPVLTRPSPRSEFADEFSARHGSPSVADTLAAELVPMPTWKRALDIVGAAVGIPLMFPVFAAISVAITLDSRGGPIFRQERLGKGGRPFTCWKFRSMERNAESRKAELMAFNEAEGNIFKMKHDPRRTRVGTFLRRTSLDELPQLVNVLRGDMSLVGPRPPTPAEVKAYRPEELRRLVVVPGMTGLWQVSLRRQHNFANMVALDAEYVRRFGLKTDIEILFRTVATVLRGTGSY